MSKEMDLHTKMESSINIAQLIEHNPITRLSKEYENRLVHKIQLTFNDTEQRLFLTSFFMYLNYDSAKDFVIDFDNVWKWLGFTRKESAKKLLERHFTIEIDYKSNNCTKLIHFQSDVDEKKEEAPFILENFATADGEGKSEEELPSSQHSKIRGGSNKETIHLTVNAFKKFCMKAGTKKADEIHDYYIKIETMIQETVNEETAELKEQLLKKDEVILDKIEQYNRLQSNHDRLLYKRSRHQYRKGKCLYINQQNNVENKYKFGITNDLNSRISAYKTYDITDFLYIVFTEANKLLEDCVKHKFRKFLTTQGSEWISNVPLNDILTFLKEITNTLELESNHYTNMDDIIVKDEREDSCHTEIVVIGNDTEASSPSIAPSEQNEDLEEKKKCNKCLLILSKRAFNKDRSKNDDLHTTCRLCEKEAKKKYILLKKDIMESIKEKQCRACQQTKDISEFTKHLYMKDGYVNFCNACVYENSNTKRKLDRENQIRYQCGRCSSTYARKDTLTKHQRQCVQVV